MQYCKSKVSILQGPRLTPGLALIPTLPAAVLIYNSVLLHADIFALILVFFKGSIRRSFISVTK